MALFANPQSFIPQILIALIQGVSGGVAIVLPYLVRVLSERDPIRFGTLIQEVVASKNMRKQYVLAVVDDEDELTYYEIKLPQLAGDCTTLPPLLRHDAVLVGTSAMVMTKEGSDLELAGYGKRLDPERLILAPVELLYLSGTGTIANLGDYRGT